MTYFRPLDYEEQQQLQRRYHRAGWWLGMLPEHPNIPGGYNPNAMYHPPPPPPPQPQYAPPPGPPPGVQEQPHFEVPFHYQWPYPQQYAAAPPQAARLQVPDPAVPRVNTGQIHVSVPLNTNVAGAVPTRDTIKLPTDISWVDFQSRICAKMDVLPANTSLGYKYHDDRRNDAAHQLSNEEQLRQALDRGIAMMRRARTRTIVLEVHNLTAVLGQSMGPGGKKRKAAVGTADDIPPALRTSMDFTKELRELKAHLACAKHNGRWCWNNPITGEHVYLDLYAVTLWAKKYFLGQADLQHPPDNLSFDHTAKRPRTSRPRNTAPAHSIQVTVNNSPFNGRSALPRLNVEQSSDAGSTSAAINAVDDFPLVDLTVPSQSNSPPPPPYAESASAAGSSFSRPLSDSSTATDAPAGELTPLSTLPDLMIALNAIFPHINFFQYVQPLTEADLRTVADIHSVSFDILVTVFHLPLEVVEPLAACVQEIMNSM